MQRYLILIYRGRDIHHVLPISYNTPPLADNCVSCGAVGRNSWAVR